MQRVLHARLSRPDGMERVRLRASMPAPEELAQDIMENLQSAMDGFGELLAALKK